ncbi:MAG: pentapeptide repeat-containing protein [Leptolyngbyaceae cyanobacterium]
MERRELSARDRLSLKQTLCALPKPQFDDLVFALNPPKGNLPGDAAPQSDRAMALLEWTESVIGPGLVELEGVLQSIISTHAKTAEYYLSFAISGRISNKTADEVRAIVELLRKKTGDDSIDVAFFREGSIEVVLSGSLEGLEQLWELFEAGEFEELGLPPVEGLDRVERDNEDARKARLIQALRMNDHAKVIFRNSGDFASANYRANELNNAMVRAARISRVDAEDLIRANELANLLAEMFSRNRRELSQSKTFLVRAIERAKNLIHELTSNLESYQDSDLYSALTTAYELIRNIDRLTNIPSDNFDLMEADLRGANLSNLNLKGINLSGADLTNADVQGTVFGGNEGLTESEKLDLERRGAIIQDPPSSDVPSLVLR